MANYKLRGSSQVESLVVRCTAEDKEAIRELALSQGTSMSNVVRELLIENNYIKASY